MDFAAQERELLSADDEARRPGHKGLESRSAGCRTTLKPLATWTMAAAAKHALATRGIPLPYWLFSLSSSSEPHHVSPASPFLCSLYAASFSPHSVTATAGSELRRSFQAHCHRRRGRRSMTKYIDLEIFMVLRETWVKNTRTSKTCTGIGSLLRMLRAVLSVGLAAGAAAFSLAPIAAPALRPSPFSLAAPVAIRTARCVFLFQCSCVAA